jgi:hypothetical protein
VLEVEDVPQVRPAPFVDRLVRIAHDAQVAVLRGEPLDQHVLRAVGVLVLVHHHVAELLRVALSNRLGFLHELHRVEQQVVEVERARLLQRIGIHRVQLAQLLVTGVPGVCEGLGPLHPVLRVADARQHHPRLHRRVVDAQLAQPLLHDRELVVRVVDHEIARQADVRRLAPQQAGAQGMKRGDPHLPAVDAEQGLDARPHLFGGLVGEGDRQNGGRVGQPFACQIGNAVGDDAGLARTGTRQNEQRAGSL